MKNYDKSENYIISHFEYDEFISASNSKKKKS